MNTRSKINCAFEGAFQSETHQREEEAILDLKAQAATAHNVWTVSETFLPAKPLPTPEHFAHAARHTEKLEGAYAMRR